MMRYRGNSTSDEIRIVIAIFKNLSTFDKKNWNFDNFKKNWPKFAHFSLFKNFCVIQTQNYVNLSTKIHTYLEKKICKQLNAFGVNELEFLKCIRTWKILHVPRKKLTHRSKWSSRMINFPTSRRVQIFFVFDIFHGNIL